jgi:hypothetical protein
MKEGSEHASAAPENARSTASSVKFLAQLRNIRNTPHMKDIAAQIFPNREPLHHEICRNYSASVLHLKSGKENIQAHATKPK